MQPYYDRNPRGDVPPMPAPAEAPGAPRRQFMGFPPYLAAASVKLGLGGPEAKTAADLARRQPVVGQLASHVSQAYNLADKAEALRHGYRMLDGLRIVVAAAEAMLADLAGESAPAAVPPGDTPPPLGSRVPARRGPGRPRKDG